MAAQRGVIYIKWGSKTDDALRRSMASVAEFHPELPIHVITLPDGATLLDKAKMLDLTPFEQTLFLDVDTIVMDRLDFGFTKADRLGLACCICECPWARRFGGIAGDTIEYNTGVLFFTRAMRPLFDLWKTLVSEVDSSFLIRTGESELGRVALNDQAGFASAVEQSGICPFVLQMNWNFRPLWQKSICGPLKIWHDYAPLPTGLTERNRRQTGEEKVLDFSRFA
jgi:hypothetical protein